ncbi:glycoside hydrolase family 16 protein [Winogradskyella aurantiaca]|uniref:glycoside hydrolase family 16 protein n=1 Tax=Winogradskyella aurantiaca TaxID=2219558 RepID=UPI001E341044|nr:glycoside hydrolase family 16 protein [Winogradskyella aurantiaca]
MKRKMKFMKMKKFNMALIAAIGLVFLTVGCNTDENQQVINHYTNLVLDEGFGANGSPDSELWNFDIGNGAAEGIPGWGNNEQQYYTDRPENVIVEDGVLKIIARREQFEGSPYTSARIQTKNKFQRQYGRFEARIKLPWGQGLWPAFWMLGDDQGGTEIWPQIGEIDVMEMRGQEPTITHGSVHGPGYSGGNAVTKSYDLVDDRLDTGFHVFGVEWGPNFINYYIDDVLYNQITPEDVDGEWVFDDEFYIILNVAVGGTFVGSVGADTVFPQTMEVDYVRVYN